MSSGDSSPPREAATIESGIVTKDLDAISHPPAAIFTTEGFIAAIADRLRARVGVLAAAR